MKQKSSALSQRYLAALGKNLKQGPQASLQPALKMGREAVALGLDTLDLARIHEQALAALKLSNVNNALTKLAGIFFTAANTLIEETHQAARQTKVHLGRLAATLERRTKELAVSNRQLQQGTARRKVMEHTAEEKGRRQNKSLEESLKLQQRQRQLTHRVIVAQEKERKKISRELQDEIAQTLLGINVRLLTLKTAAKGNRGSMTKEIASMQGLVVASIQSINQFARELDIPPQTSGVR